MYARRIKIFIIIIASLLAVCILRLMQLQLLPNSSVQEKIAELKLKRGSREQLTTLRGQILDRKGRILAVDEINFELCINYHLTQFLDPRVRRAKLLRAENSRNPDSAIEKINKEFDAGINDVNEVIEKCTYFGYDREEIEKTILQINDNIWNLRRFLAWIRNEPNDEILEKYNHKINSIPLSEAMADFENKFQDENQRLVLIAGIDDIADMDSDYLLFKLKTDDDIFTAQIEFMDIEEIKILSENKRVYPYNKTAAQTIGWVGPAQEKEKRLFANDKLLSYLHGELCGKEDGVEYVCEAVLRGKRGEVLYDIDKELINRTETVFGEDVSLTIDIELQKRIEGYITDCNLNQQYCLKPTAAVVIDAAGGDILAMVSLPSFDLNLTRYDYGKLLNDANEPLINRVINQDEYPPGSIAKPLILVAGLESGKITPEEIIDCHAQPAPSTWPNCWIYDNSHSGHSLAWSNHARNAIKGSCNIYFSHLADRIEPSTLQKWLYKFGYGRRINLIDENLLETESKRNLRQFQGQISSSIVRNKIEDFNDTPPLKKGESRYFGIGQGNFRVTPLQVANAMAVLAREGFYKPPRLLMQKNDSNLNQPVYLNISQQTIDTVYDGMSAVVNEPSGTAYKEFQYSSFAEHGITVYGKTGSTEKPSHAWFAGFAKDTANRSIALAVIVEGGQHGSSDAGPIARSIIQFCLEEGYIGQNTITNPTY